MGRNRIPVGSDDRQPVLVLTAEMDGPGDYLRISFLPTKSDTLVTLC